MLLSRWSGPRGRYPPRRKRPGETCPENSRRTSKLNEWLNMKIGSSPFPEFLYPLCSGSSRETNIWGVYYVLVCWGTPFEQTRTIAFREKSTLDQVHSYGFSITWRMGNSGVKMRAVVILGPPPRCQPAPQNKALLRDDDFRGCHGPLVVHNPLLSSI